MKVDEVRSGEWGRILQDKTKEKSKYLKSKAHYSLFNPHPFSKEDKSNTMKIKKRPSKATDCSTVDEKKNIQESGKDNHI